MLSDVSAVRSDVAELRSDVADLSSEVASGRSDLSALTLRVGDVERAVAEEGQNTRRYFDVMVEKVEAAVKIVAEVVPITALSSTITGAA
jgi:hypothetical protein